MTAKDLLNIGLGEKEAEVYLATLQLGYGTVVKIAAKAEINRTTAYTHIKNLIGRGLMMSVEKNGKLFFIAEKPVKLKFFCDQQEQEMARRRATIERIMPELESLYNLAADRPSVRLYGEEALATVRREIEERRADRLYNIFNYEKYQDYLNPEHIRRLIESSLHFQALYISENKVLDRALHEFRPFNEKFHIKHLPFRKFNLLCEILVADDQVYIARDADTLIIKDKLFAETLKLLFLALWELAEEF
jgi:sugar-specific transcriptional regulator TrmB